MRRVLVLLAALPAILLGVAVSQAQAPTLTLRVGVDDSKHVETIKTLQISKRAGGIERVVSSLPPSQVGAVRPGHEIEGFAETEFSVTCLEPMPQCVGKRYRFSPKIQTRFVLGDSATDRTGINLGSPARITCAQDLPNRNHHCRVELARSAKIDRDYACMPGCYLNVVGSAYHRKAKKGNVVVLGGDSDSGINQGKATLSSANFSRPSAQFRTEANPEGRRLRGSVPIVSRSQSSKEVSIYSVPLPELKRGESLVVDARATLTINGLPYNVLIQPELIVAESPTKTEFTGLPVQVVSNNGKISNENGANCTRGKSYFDNPCQVRKFGAARIELNAREQPHNDKGPYKTLHLNLLIGAAQEYGGDHSKGDSAKVKSVSIKLRRYGAQYSR